MTGPSIRVAADDAFLVSFGERATPEVTERVRRLATVLASDAPPWVRNWRPAYTTVLVDFDLATVDADEVQNFLAAASARDDGALASRVRVVEIPVCYELPHAPDLADVARHHDVPPEVIVARHTAGRYPVLFLGFCPGFAYLDGLDPSLATPRLANARPRVPAGSVGIGGTQTGVYPIESPGGWRLIGRTPLRLFDAAADPPALLGIGDVVRFRAITPRDYEAWPSP